MSDFITFNQHYNYSYKKELACYVISLLYYIAQNIKFGKLVIKKFWQWVSTVKIHDDISVCYIRVFQ